MLHCFPWPHLRSFRWNCGSHYCFPILSFLSNNKEIFHHYCYWLDSSWILWKLPNFSSFQNAAHVEIDFHSFWYNLYRHWMDKDWSLRVGFYSHNDTRNGDDDNNSNKTRGGCGNFGNVIYLSTFACTTVSLWMNSACRLLMLLTLSSCCVFMS